MFTKVLSKLCLFALVLTDHGFLAKKVYKKVSTKTIVLFFFIVTNFVRKNVKYSNLLISIFQRKYVEPVEEDYEEEIPQENIGLLKDQCEFLYSVFANVSHVFRILNDFR